MKKLYKSNRAGKLAAYSAMAGAMVLAGQGVKAQIVYTDVNPDETYSDDGEFYELDLDMDGSVDFKIGVVNFTYPGAFSTTGGATFGGLFQDVFIYPYNGVVAGTLGTPGYAYPYALNAGDMVDGGLSFQSNSVQSMIYYGGVLDYPAAGSVYAFFSSGAWIGVTDKYLGLRVDAGGSSNYGWARLDASDNHHEFTIKDYAIQSTPETGIEAGAQVGVYTVIQPDQLSAYSYGNTINIVVKSLDAKAGTVKVFDVDGKVVFNGSLNLSGMSVSMNNAATGVYTLQVVTESNAVYTKQLYIQN